MTSIRDSIAELDRYHQLRQTTLDCYIAAIRSAGHYAVELDEKVTAAYRKHLEALAADVASGDRPALMESRATLRALLRDYRDKAARFIGDLREQLANSAKALEEILNNLAQCDGDHEAGLRSALQRLRELSSAPECAPVRDALGAATDSIEQSVEQMRKQHELTISQFQVEIHMLHKRIDELEAAAMIDSLSKLFSRGEMEERIRAAGTDWFALLLIRAGGLRSAEFRFDTSVAVELAGAFGKRLRNCLPADAVIGRWGPEEFVAKVSLGKRDAMAAAKWVTENLSGAYSCLLEGKTVRPSLQVSVAVADREPGETPERTLGRVAEFFEGVKP